MPWGCISAKTLKFIILLLSSGGGGSGEPPNESQVTNGVPFWCSTSISLSRIETTVKGTDIGNVIEELAISKATVIFIPISKPKSFQFSPLFKSILLGSNSVKVSKGVKIFSTANLHSKVNLCQSPTLPNSQSVVLLGLN